MLLEDFTSLIIFSFFLFGRNLMGKQMFNSFVVWLTSSGTWCFLDLPILLSASLLLPLFLNFFCGSESGHALFYSGILRKIAFPVLFLPVNILEVGFWLPRVDRMVEVLNMIKKKKKQLQWEKRHQYLPTNYKSENWKPLQIPELPAPNEALPTVVHKKQIRRYHPDGWNLAYGVALFFFPSLANLLFFYNCNKVPSPKLMTGFPSAQSQMFSNGCHVLDNL